MRIWTCVYRMICLSIAPGRAAGPVMTFGLDVFNVLNRVNDVAYIGTLTSPFFGQAVAAQSPRRLQLSVRARF